MEAILDVALTQSIWAALSIALIFYILKKQEARDVRQEEREGKYQAIITELTKQLNVVTELKEDVEEIKEVVKRNA